MFKMDYNQFMMVIHWLVNGIEIPFKRFNGLWDKVDKVGPNDWLHNKIVWMGLISLVIVTVSVLFEFWNKNRCLPGKTSLFYVLYEFNVKYVYQKQSHETIVTLMSGVQTVLKSCPERPAVLLLMAPTGAYATAVSIAMKLAHIVMLSFEYPMEERHLGRTRLYGTAYTSFEDYWSFHRQLAERMEKLKVAVISEFHQVHPQVTTALCHLADDTYSPFPQSVIVLVMDVGERFTEEELKRKSAVTLAETYLQEILGPFLDAELLGEVMRHVTGRAVLVAREPRLTQSQTQHLRNRLTELGYFSPPLH